MKSVHHSNVFSNQSKVSCYETSITSLTTVTLMVIKLLSITNPNDLDYIDPFTFDHFCKLSKLSVCKPFLKKWSFILKEPVLSKKMFIGRHVTQNLFFNLNSYYRIFHTFRLV